MRNIVSYLIITILLSISFSCTTKTSNFTLKGSIKNLKKGTVYLQKIEDSTMVSLDSVEIKGQELFELNASIDEPVLLYLKLFKYDNEELFLPFFADKGETTIVTNLKNFNFDAVITGSEQQKLLEEYRTIISDYNNKNLELIKANFLAQKANDTVAADSLIERSDNLLKRQYAYTINFALNHKDSEIAPYLALFEIPDTNIKYLDTIYNALSPRIKTSMYGKDLKKAIARRRSDMK